MKSLRFPQFAAPATDWRELRLAGERELLLAIERRQICPLSADRAASQWPASAASLVADPMILPAVCRVGKFLGDILGFRKPVELVLIPDARPAPACTSEDPWRIAVAGRFFDEFSVREALFVLGRTLAPMLLEHSPLPDFSERTDCPNNAERNLFRGLQRLQELSRDRIGLVCAQDPTIAARALIKSLSGVSSDLVRIDLEAITRLAPPHDEALLGDSTLDFLLLRITSLHTFFESSDYRKVFSGLPNASPKMTAPSPAAGQVAQDAGCVGATDCDPEFSAYRFRSGESVEVLLDGKWCAGTVIAIERTGDVRVRFLENDVLRLNPTADIIRPVPQAA